MVVRVWEFRHDNDAICVCVPHDVASAEDENTRGDGDATCLLFIL